MGAKMRSVPHGYIDGRGELAWLSATRVINYQARIAVPQILSHGDKSNRVTTNP